MAFALLLLVPISWLVYNLSLAIGVALVVVLILVSRRLASNGKPLNRAVAIVWFAAGLLVTGAGYAEDKKARAVEAVAQAEKEQLKIKQEQARVREQEVKEIATKTSNKECERTIMMAIGAERVVKRVQEEGPMGGWMTLEMAQKNEKENKATAYACIDTVQARVLAEHGLNP